MLLGTLIYFAIDFYYFIWVLQLKQKLPATMASFVSDAIFGYTGKMHLELNAMLSKSDQAKVAEKKKELDDKITAYEKKKKEEEDAAKKAKLEEAARLKAEKANKGPKPTVKK